MSPPMRRCCGVRIDQPHAQNCETVAGMRSDDPRRHATGLYPLGIPSAPDARATWHTEYPFAVRFVDGRQVYPYARNAQEALVKAVARASGLGYVNPEVVLLQRADEPSTREVEHGWLWRLFFGGV